MRLKCNKINIRTERISEFIYIKQRINAKCEDYITIKNKIDFYVETYIHNYTSLKEWYDFARFIKAFYNIPMYETIEIIDNNIEYT